MQDDNGALPFHVACRAGRMEVVELLWPLSQGQGYSNHLENMATNDGWTPLLLVTCHAPHTDSATSVMSFLIEKGADVNCRSSDGLTALHHASRSFDALFVDILLQAGAKLSQTAMGDTELHLAVQRGSLEVVDILLRHGADADVNTQDCLGRTPLSLYVQKSGMYAHEDVIDLLVKHGASLDARDLTGKTIREWAVEKQNRLYNWDITVIKEQ